MSNVVEVASQVVPGAVVAPIALFNPDGVRVETTGAFYHEGHVEETEGLSLDGINFGVATRKYAEYDTEKAVVVLKADEQPGVAEVDVLTLTPRADGEVEPDLAAGALVITMKEHEIATARLAKVGAHISGKFAERMGFKKDEATGSYVFKTNPRKISPQPIAW